MRGAQVRGAQVLGKVRMPEQPNAGERARASAKLQQQSGHVKEVGRARRATRRTASSARFLSRRWRIRAARASAKPAAGLQRHQSSVAEDNNKRVELLYFCTSYCYLFNPAMNECVFLGGFIQIR